MQLQQQNKEIQKLQKLLTSQKQAATKSASAQASLLPPLPFNAGAVPLQVNPAMQPGSLNITMKMKQPHFLALYAVTRDGTQAIRVRVLPVYLKPTPGSTENAKVTFPRWLHPLLLRRLVWVIENE